MSNNEPVSVAEQHLKSEFEREVLNRLRQFLCDHLEPERFFPFLQTKNYLDVENCEQIRNSGTTKGKVNKMLDILMRSGRQPLFALAKAIEKSGSTQRFVAERLRAEYNRWLNRAENISRLESVRQSHNNDDDETTAQYDISPSLPPIPMPPPYSPYPHTIHSLPPSHFPPFNTVNQSINPPKSSPKQFELSSQFMSSTHDLPMARSRSPGSSSFLSSYRPSQFVTNDFPDSTDLHAEIRGDQEKAERKIPPPLNGISVSQNLGNDIQLSQEKEFRRYQSDMPDPTMSCSYPKSPRTPSEHDASGNEPRNTRLYKSQISCQTASIQPSSFNYSSVCSDASPRLQPTDLEESATKRGTSRTNVFLNREFSIPDTIHSEEVPTNVGSVTQIRNPTEHTDASMTSENDNDEMSLEISKEP